jgi:hypothetical protein
MSVISTSCHACHHCHQPPATTHPCHLFRLDHKIYLRCDFCDYFFVVHERTQENPASSEASSGWLPL